MAALFDLWMKALERSACFRALRTEETVYRLAVPVLFVAVLKGTEPVLTAPDALLKETLEAAVPLIFPLTVSLMILVLHLVIEADFSVAFD